MHRPKSLSGVGAREVDGKKTARSLSGAPFQPKTAPHEILLASVAASEQLQPKSISQPKAGFSARAPQIDAAAASARAQAPQKNRPVGQQNRTPAAARGDADHTRNARNDVCISRAANSHKNLEPSSKARQHDRHVLELRPVEPAERVQRRRLVHLNRERGVGGVQEPEPYQLPHDRAVATMNEDEDESYLSESSGESIVPDLGGDEDDDPSAKATGAGLLGYLGLGQQTKLAADDCAYDFEGEPQEQDDEHYDFGDDEEPELDEDELLAEEGLKDDRSSRRGPFSLRRRDGGRVGKGAPDEGARVPEGGAHAASLSAPSQRYGKRTRVTRVGERARAPRAGAGDAAESARARAHDMTNAQVAVMGRVSLQGREPTGSLTSFGLLGRSVGVGRLI